MKTLYFDCGMGAAGDMLMASLYEICPDKEKFLKMMNEMGLPGLSVEAEPSVKCGITGTHMKVTIHGEEEESVDVDLQGHEHHHDHDHEHAHDHHHEHNHEHNHDHTDDHHDHSHEDHHHSHEMADEQSDLDHAHDHRHSHHHHTSMAGISHIIEHLELPEEVKTDIVAVYRLIAEAESHVHGKTVEEIHFHEVGTADAIADIAGVCLLMHMIAPKKVIASPIHVGSGNVHCAHGILPVPAPATAYILQGLPIYSGDIRGELCTPTGAALLKHFVTEFKEMPVMRTAAIGYGMGKKDFERANCVRVLLGEIEETGSEVTELSCNLDDMTPEALGFVQEILFAAGALEVYTIPIGMKKSRPGILLTCMCRCNDKEKMVSLLFKHTTTLGIRESISKRYTLTRTIKEHETPYGVIREKVSEGYGVCRGKLEYEDIAKIASENGMSLEEVKELVEK